MRLDAVFTVAPVSIHRSLSGEEAFCGVLTVTGSPRLALAASPGLAPSRVCLPSCRESSRFAGGREFELAGVSPRLSPLGSRRVQRLPQFGL